jgi:hypothetical protein
MQFRQFNQRHFWIGLAACAVIGQTGCGRPSLSTVPVQGKVTWNGKPLTSGDIAFHPTQLAEGGVNRLAMGRLDNEGNYTLSTVTHGDGVQPGDYAVVIVSRAGPARQVDATEGPVASTIPLQYSVVTTTPLKAKIEANASGPLQFDFDLK